MDNAIRNPLIGALWLASCGVAVGWYRRRVRTGLAELAERTELRPSDAATRRLRLYERFAIEALALVALCVALFFLLSVWF